MFYIRLRGVIKKFWARYASVRFIELKSLSVCHFDLIEGHWECEKHAVMLSYICKIEKLEIRVVIKYFCKKGMALKEIHEDFFL